MRQLKTTKPTTNHKYNNESAARSKKSINKENQRHIKIQQVIAHHVSEGGGYDVARQVHTLIIRLGDPKRTTLAFAPFC